MMRRFATPSGCSFFFSSRRRHTIFDYDWSSDVCSSDLTSKTNKDGRYTIIFNGGGGDYLMTVSAIGFQPYRFEVRREVDEDVLIADATLAKQEIGRASCRERV